MVRPLNRKYMTKEDDFYAKSRARCPTYGSCYWCYSSGPVGQICKHCNDPKRGYYLVAFLRSTVVDSITLAEMLGRGHETTRTDCTFNWIRDPLMNLSTDAIKASLQRKKDANSKETVHKIMMNLYGLQGEIPEYFGVSSYYELENNRSVLDGLRTEIKKLLEEPGKPE